MSDVALCIVNDHDPWLVALALCIGMFGAVATAQLVARLGSVKGAIVGGVIMGVIETVSMGTLSFHFPWVKEINDVIVWIVLIAVLMIRPTGILGQEEVDRV